jgi:hypothetical protein
MSEEKGSILYQYILRFKINNYELLFQLYVLYAANVTCCKLSVILISDGGIGAKMLIWSRNGSAILHFTLPFLYLSAIQRHI